MSDEVELSDAESDEYEVVPMGPIRRLERKIQELEEKDTGSIDRDQGMLRDMVEMMKNNQQMVNSMVESTGRLRNSVEDLVGKMDQMTEDMHDFLELLEEASETSMQEDVSHEISGDFVDPLTDKLDEVVQTNERMLQGLSAVSEGVQNLDGRMKRLYASQKDEPFNRPSRKRRRSSGDDDGGSRFSRARSGGDGNRSGSRFGRNREQDDTESEETQSRAGPSSSTRDSPSRNR